MSYMQHATTHGRYKKTPDNAGALYGVNPLGLAAALASVERASNQGDGNPSSLIRASVPEVHQLGAEVLDLADVRRVHADKRASLDSSVKLRLYSGDARGVVGAPCGKAHAVASTKRLDCAVGRGDWRAFVGFHHQRGALGVAVACKVTDVCERGVNGAEDLGAGVNGIGDDEN